VPGLHPTRAAEISVHGQVVGAVGEVDPEVLAAHGITERVAWLEIDLGRVLELPHGARPYQPISKYPSSDIDLAFATPDAVPAADVAAALQDAAGPLLVRLELFDVYRGTGIDPGSRSLAYRLRFQAPDHTLTDAELAEVRERCIAAVQRLGASLRA
jgi:phenylalanyl-tRNA synthetase beta chain